jgi:hypothetical protein
LEHLKVPEDDIFTFILAWKLGSTEIGEITKSQFVDGFSKMKYDFYVFFILI